MPPDRVLLFCGRRNPLFYVGEPIRFQLRGGAPGRYEVRDFWGELVEQGEATPSVAIGPRLPGWYKLYVYGRELPERASPERVRYRETYGDAVGGTTFVVLRKDARFPVVPARTGFGSAGSDDEPLRGLAGIGPQRLYVADAGKPDQEIRRLEADVALDKRFYLPFDRERGRVLMMAFSRGTKGRLAGVRRIVEHFKNDVRYWEPRNEPNFGSSAGDFVRNELAPFYQAVKSVDPGLKVMGPGTVSIGPQLRPWLEDFFKAGGGKYIDAFSFHFYNGLNGDLRLGRESMDTLQSLLARYDLAGIEKWQTEQGYFCCVYGSYQPHLQGRWTMLEMMLFEQYGIPKEHNVLWYDRSHGFWDMPTWWENQDASLNPAFALMRVWSEELYGRHFVRRYRFGPSAEELYIGSLFEGTKGPVAVFQSAGSTDGQISLSVRGGSALHVVSAFGVESDVPVRDGRVLLAVPEMPVYVELAPGQEIDVQPQDWGPDLALEPGVKATASGTGRHPVDGKIPNDISKIVNGVLENWYWLQQPSAQPWMDDTPQFPAWVELQFPRSVSVSRVVIFAAVPWQWGGTLTAYELQYRSQEKWVTLARVNEPLKTFKAITPATRTKVDSFFSDRCVFEHHFPTIRTTAIRLLVHNTTFGGGATEDVGRAGGQTGPHHVNLREIEVFGR